MGYQFTEMCNTSGRVMCKIAKLMVYMYMCACMRRIALSDYNIHAYKEAFEEMRKREVYLATCD